MKILVRQHVAALRALLACTVICGICYPLVIFVVAQLPGLRANAAGSIIEQSGTGVGSAHIGQQYTDGDGNALPQYFQSRPSAAAYDPLASGASNLGPESVVDVLPDPAVAGSGKPSLLSTVCARSKAIGEREGVDGARPFCTPSGVGAVLAVFGVRNTQGHVPAPTRVVSVNEPCDRTPFVATYQGVQVECAVFGADYRAGLIVPVRGTATRPQVPADAVTASGSGLDPHISPEYAALQVNRIARVRGVDPAAVRALVEAHTDGRILGFLGEPRVQVLQLNLALDARYPMLG